MIALGKIKKTIQKYRMLEPGDGVVVGVSGGPDSVMLCHVLNRLRDRCGLTLTVAHLNHGIRGAEAARDARCVERFARGMGAISQVGESKEAAAALANAAVYFKSGSLYECAPEAGFTCKPYAGNAKNFMNSVAIVEHPAGARRLYYMVTIVSNVLRRNSASVHMELATRLQKLVESLHAAPSAGLVPAGAAGARTEAGR